MIVGAEGEEDRDYDFLASIELLIMDQMDIFLMQNWDHLLHVLDHLHLQPKKTHDTDFSRVRSWAVNGWSKYYRFDILHYYHELILVSIIRLSTKMIIDLKHDWFRFLMIWVDALDNLTPPYNSTLTWFLFLSAFDFYLINCNSEFISLRIKRLCFCIIDFILYSFISYVDMLFMIDTFPRLRSVYFVL